MDIKNLDLKLRKEIAKPLNGMELMKKLDFKPNIITYDNIHLYKDLDELLGESKACILLYLTKHNYGHWCCVYENDNVHIIFFDSYGFIPDDQLNFISKQLRKELRQEHRILTKLLYKSNKPVEYNEYKLQEEKEYISTCGRWVIVRLQYKNISIDNFANLFLENKDIIKPDVLITILTN